MTGEGLDRDEGGGGAVFDAEFFENVAKVLLHCFFAATEDGGDVAVAFSGSSLFCVEPGVKAG